MRKERRVEVDSHFARLTPVRPALEVVVGDFVAVYFLSAEFAVYGVQVYARFTGDILAGFVDVGAELVGVARLAGEVARRLDSAASERCVGRFESAHVVALPAVHRKRDLIEDFHRLFGIDPEVGVNLFR